MCTGRGNLRIQRKKTTIIACNLLGRRVRGLEVGIVTVTGSGAMSLNEIISIRQIGISCACRAAFGSWQMTFTFVAVNIFIKKFEFSRIECDACLTFSTHLSR